MTPEQRQSKRPIRRVLVANRGEIAVRIVRACRSLGLEAVVVVSAADRDSRAAEIADRAVCIGPAQSRNSYLRADLIVHAAIATKCDALHPGYGFLAEQPALPALCAENGVTFIGPDAATIGLMGNKLAARNAARGCGIPILPGSERIATFDEAAVFARECGYPILIKAAAGGGGRGMRVVTNAADLRAALQTTTSEAGAAFGDPTVYLERFVAEARHIEVQVLGDHTGHVVHLGERDCSLQRRHQKIIEETPAPLLPEPVRDEIRMAAVRLAKSVSYVSAGTVEFLYDKLTSKFYFLEMNTRIQVEHPVSEMTTGVDIVAEQIRIAGGRSIDRPQDQIALSGHAIEARITAENPDEGFRPSPGRISRWREPEAPGIRIDTQCYEGYIVPPFYDSLIAKVISHAPTRDEAAAKLYDALTAFEIEGIRTNKDYLIRLLSGETFMQARHNTQTIDASLARPAAARH